VVLTLDILIVKGAAAMEHTAALVWAIFVAGSPNLVN
jgi:hypothetical protein